jgi:kumamolisin
VAQFNAAFGVDLQRFEYEGGSYRGRVGAVQLPDELQGVVEAVLGLDDRPAAKPHFRRRQSPGNVHWHTNGAGATSFTPLQVASLYNYPTGTGQGECVAIIELGGGERTADLTTYFSGLGIQKAPNVTAVSVRPQARTCLPAEVPASRLRRPASPASPSGTMGRKEVLAAAA